MTLKARATLIRRHFPAWQRPLGLFLLGFWPWSRMVSGDALARLSGRPGFAEAARMWGDVWRARADWRGGYPAAAVLSRTPGAPRGRTACGIRDLREKRHAQRMHNPCTARINERLRL